MYLTFSIIIILHAPDSVWDCAAACPAKPLTEDSLRSVYENSPLTQKYGDKTTHVSIKVLFVLKLISSPVLTQLRTGPKNYRFSIPIGRNRNPRGPLWTAGPRAIAWVAWCLNTLLVDILFFHAILKTSKLVFLHLLSSIVVMYSGNLTENSHCSFSHAIAVLAVQKSHNLPLETSDMFNKNPWSTSTPLLSNELGGNLIYPLFEARL